MILMKIYKFTHTYKTYFMYSKLYNNVLGNEIVICIAVQMGVYVFLCNIFLIHLIDLIISLWLVVKRLFHIV